MDNIAGGLTVFIIFLGFSSLPIVAILAYYFVKRLKHKEILAAIEKGVPISELHLDEDGKQGKANSGPGWIKDISSGVIFLLIAIGITVLLLLATLEIVPNHGRTYPLGLFIIPIVFFGIGIGRLIRGLMRRKYEPQGSVSDKINEPVSVE